MQQQSSAGSDQSQNRPINDCQPHQAESVTTEQTHYSHQYKEQTMHSNRDNHQSHAHHTTSGGHVHDHQHGHHGHHHPHPIKVDIKVNGTIVVMHEKCSTGLEIKQAALNQGAPIQLTFVLQVEHEDGTSAIVGDGDHVHLHEGQHCPRRFKSEPLCRSNIEPGLVADQWMVSCG